VAIIETLLKFGPIAELVSLVLEMHQSRRNRPSFIFTQEGMNADATADVGNGMSFAGLHFRGLIRNDYLNATT
jgi:hypothetical protein